MEEKSKKRGLFTIWFLLATLSITWIILSFMSGFSTLLIKPFFLLAFIISVFSIFVAIVSLYNIIRTTKEEQDKDNEIQSNIRDYYQYQQLLEPPELNN